MRASVADCISDRLAPAFCENNRFMLQTHWLTPCQSSSPGVVIANTNSVGASLVVWLVAGLLAWTGASSFAELGTAIPLNGGPQVGPLNVPISFHPHANFRHIWPMPMVPSSHICSPGQRYLPSSQVCLPAPCLEYTLISFIVRRKCRNSSDICGIYKSDILACYQVGDITR
jgi:hypothetical protein